MSEAALAAPFAHGTEALIAFQFAGSAQTEYDLVLSAHAAHFTRLLERLGPLLRGAGTTDEGQAQLHALRQLQLELENVVMTVDTALARHNRAWLQPLAQHLRLLLDQLNEYQRLEEVSAALLAEALLLADEPLQLQARLGLAKAARNLGRYDDACQELVRAEDLALAQGDQAGIAACAQQTADREYAQGSFARAGEIYAEWLQRYRDERNSFGVANMLMGLGNVAFCQGEHDQAQEFYGAGLEANRAIGSHRGVSMALTNLGILEHARGNYDQAGGFFAAALTMLAESNDRLGEAMALNSLGNTEYRLGHIPLAHDLYARALALRLQIGDRRGQAICYNNLGNIEAQQGRYEAARELYRQALAIKRELGERDGEARSLINLGNMDFLEGHSDAARSSYQLALQLAREVGERYVEAAVQQCLGNLDLLAGNHATAQQQLETALRAFCELGNKSEMVSCCASCGTLHSMQNDFRLAVLGLYAAQSCAAAIGYHFAIDDEPVLTAGLQRLDQARQAGDLTESEFGQWREMAEALDVDELTELTLQSLAARRA